MAKNSRFPLPEKSTQAPFQHNTNTPMPTNTRFPRSGRQNPFSSYRQADDRSQQPLKINSRAKALLAESDNDRDRPNAFQSHKNSSPKTAPYNSRFGYHNNDKGRSFRQNDNHRNTFRRNTNSRSRFRRPSPIKRPTFSMKEEDFPTLGNQKSPPKKTDDDPKPPENKASPPPPLSFKSAAKRGEKCTTPTHCSTLKPLAHRARQEKYASDDESTGWNSDDELAARVADPSDDESDGERFWGRSEI